MASPEKWLQNRLPPKKSDTARWLQFCEAIEEYFDGEFQPLLDALIAMRSIYTADDDTLDRKIRELGGFFQQDIPDPDNRAVAVAWRRQQLLRKDTTEPLLELIYCYWNALECEWVPLWAKKNRGYGTSLVTWIEALADKGTANYFLTSRGRIQVNYGHLIESGVSRDSLLTSIYPFIKNLIPLHIIYEGLIFALIFDFILDPFSVSLLDRQKTKSFLMRFDLFDRYDIVDADVQQVDDTPVSIEIWKNGGLLYA